MHHVSRCRCEQCVLKLRVPSAARIPQSTVVNCAKVQPLCQQHNLVHAAAHGWDMDALWQGMESVWTLSWLGHGCAVGRDLHYEGAQSLHPRRQHHAAKRGCLHVVFCGAMSGPSAKP